MGQLLGYFQSPKTDSGQQLKDAQAKARSYTDEQNAQARAAGFKNADEMVLYLKAHQRTPQKASATSGLSFSDLMAWHPANTISRATDALREATNQ